MSDMAMTSTRSAYLEGNYGPVREEVTVTDLAVSGAVSDHLDGRYVRTGLNPITGRRAF